MSKPFCVINALHIFGGTTKFVQATTPHIHKSLNWRKAEYGKVLERSDGLEDDLIESLEQMTASSPEQKEKMLKVKGLKMRYRSKRYDALRVMFQHIRRHFEAT